MVSLFRKTFTTYPFPIHDPGYLEKTMAEHVLYFGAFSPEGLLGVSSAEMDRDYGNAEMTDFAVSPDARGRGLSKRLLRTMEESMRQAGLNTLYTIARLKSTAMNKTFLGAGYSYAGTLVNNTQISGAIESMNVYYKFL